MKKPYVFGHRGAMGYCIENTLPSFEKAVSFGAGIETDVWLTKDRKLVCFHDPSFKIGQIWYSIKKLTLKELQRINFEDNREIPTLEKVFKTFQDKSENIRYSCDIGNKRVGLEIINLAKKYSILDNIEITDMRMRVLLYLRKMNNKISLVHTIPLNINKINNQTIKFEKLFENNIKVLNIKNNRVNRDNFKNVIDNGFKCYVWGVNSKTKMKKVLNLKYKDMFVEAIYTDYPDILKNMIDKMNDGGINI